jgi:prepilin peptidase CpaA
MATVATALFFALLSAAAAFDFLTFKIPNYLVVAIAVLFVLFALLSRSPDWFEHIGAAALCLVAGIALYFAGGVGAGDVKLFASVALWIGFFRLLMLLLFTSLAGVVILLLILAARALAKRWGTDGLSRSWPVVLTQSTAGVPYGVAIAIGAIGTVIFGHSELLRFGY